MGGLRKLRDDAHAAAAALRELAEAQREANAVAGGSPVQTNQPVTARESTSIGGSGNRGGGSAIGGPGGSAEIGGMANGSGGSRTNVGGVWGIDPSGLGVRHGEAARSLDEILAWVRSQRERMAEEATWRFGSR